MILYFIIFSIILCLLICFYLKYVRQNEITTVMYRNPDIIPIPDNELCSICLELLLPNNTYKTPCNHYFHKLCFIKLKERNYYRCPICQQNDSIFHVNMKYSIRNIYDTYEINLSLSQLSLYTKYISINPEKTLCTIIPNDYGITYLDRCHYKDSSRVYLMLVTLPYS